MVHLRTAFGGFLYIHDNGAADSQNAAFRYTDCYVHCNVRGAFRLSCYRLCGRTASGHGTGHSYRFQWDYNALVLSWHVAAVSFLYAEAYCKYCYAECSGNRYSRNIALLFLLCNMGVRQGRTDFPRQISASDDLLNNCCFSVFLSCKISREEIWHNSRKLH